MSASCFYCGADDGACVDWADDAAVAEHEQYHSWRHHFLSIWHDLGALHVRMGIDICAGCGAYVDPNEGIRENGRIYQRACFLLRHGVPFVPTTSPIPATRWEWFAPAQTALAAEKRFKEIAGGGAFSEWRFRWLLIWKLLSVGAKDGPWSPSRPPDP